MDAPKLRAVGFYFAVAGLGAIVLGTALYVIGDEALAALEPGTPEADEQTAMRRMGAATFGAGALALAVSVWVFVARFYVRRRPGPEAEPPFGRGETK